MMAAGLFPNSTTLSAAVAEAVYMCMMEADADVVQLATYGDLMANSEDDHGSAGVSTILINAETSFGSPSWAIQSLFMHHQPAALIQSVLALSDGGGCVSWPNGGSCNTTAQSGGPSMLAASVSQAVDGDLLVKLINYGNSNVKLSIANLHAGSGELSVVAGGSSDLVNSFKEPRRVAVQRRAVAVSDKTVLELPAWSVSALRVPQ